jgi:hypothetical protein
MTRLAALTLLIALAGCDGDASDRLVGSWEPAGGGAEAEMRYTFFADGRASIVARPALGAPATFDARYDVSGDTLLTLSDAEGTERFRLTVTTDTLHLASPATGRAAAFVRVRAE